MTRLGWWAWIAGWLLIGVFAVVSLVVAPTWPKVWAVVGDVVIAAAVTWWLVRRGPSRGRLSRVTGRPAPRASTGVTHAPEGGPGPDPKRPFSGRVYGRGAPPSVPPRGWPMDGAE